MVKERKGGWVFHACVAILCSTAFSSAQDVSVPERPQWAATQGKGPTIQPGRRPPIQFEQLKAGFAHPPTRFAPYAFWFWNSDLDPELVSEMASEMAAQGLNPGYVHARPDLDPQEWLGTEWFKSFAEAKTVAEQMGMKLGYCDEYGWPSGQAAGRVLERHPDLEAISLDWTVQDVEAGESIALTSGDFVVVARHAAGENGLQDPPEGAWIWTPNPSPSSAWNVFRRRVQLPVEKRVQSARLRVVSKGEHVLFVNGRTVGRHHAWPLTGHHDIAPALLAGANAIVVRARHGGEASGLMLGLRVTFTDGTDLELCSDSTWRCSEQPLAQGNWKARRFADEAWENAHVVSGSCVEDPWRLPNSAFSHPHVTVESSTLHRLREPIPTTWTPPDSGRWRVYTFVKRMRPGLDGGRVNYLDRDLAEAFVKLAHEPYDQALAGEWGESIPGVFLDHEGDYGRQLAWSADLEREYREATDRDLLRWMPLMIDEDQEGHWARARWDWHAAVSRIYCDGFLGGVSQWLEERGLHCISNLWEETLTAQAMAVGDFFRAQRAVTLPGTDSLLDRVLKVHDFKETQSVSEFEDRLFQSELLGGAGWQMTPLLMKRAVNCATAWGVSHMVVHGVNLERRLEHIPYPADLYTANPFWRYLHLWSDYARRASYINAHGHTMPEVLLFNPMDSVWSLLGGEFYRPERRIPQPALLLRGGLPNLSRGIELNELDRLYAEAIEDLSAARVDFLVADSHYLLQMERSDAGRLTREPFSFHTLVLPPLFLLPLDVAERMVDFAEAGGVVLCLGRLPSASNQHGEGCPRLGMLMKRLAAAPNVYSVQDGNLGDWLETHPVVQPQVDLVSGDFKLLTQRRRIDGRDLYWVVNETDQAQSCRLRFNGARGAAMRWDCTDGSQTPIDSFPVSSGSEVDLDMAPYQALWILFDPMVKTRPPDSTAEGERGSKPVLGLALTLDGPWTVSFDHSVQPRSCSLPPRQTKAAIEQSSEVRPLAPWLDWDLSHFTGFLDYRTNIELPAGFGLVTLDLGDVSHTAEVFVNGQRVGAALWAPFRFDLTGFVQPGSNTLTVRVGNLLCNVMSTHVDAGTTHWRGRTPRPEHFNAGLLGPVVLRY